MIQKTVMRKLEQVVCHFRKEQTKLLLGDFNVKLGKGGIFKPTIGNESLHQDCNNDDIRIENFATSKNLVVKSTIVPH